MPAILKIKLPLAGLLLCFQVATAQVLTWSPLFSTAEDTITIIYDATQGNGALQGISPVYAHTGVITEFSQAPSDWKYVKTNWGQNTPETMLQPLGNNKWKIKFHIRSYYGVPETERILKLAFVFRNSTGSIVGRNADGSDIFLPIYEQGLNLTVVSPAQTPVFVEKDDSLRVEAIGYLAAKLSLYLEGNLLIESTADTLIYYLHATEYGRRNVEVIAEDSTGATKSRSFYYVVNSPLVVEALPAGMADGVNYIDNASATLVLYAPNKKFVYTIGDFTNWEVDTPFYMKQTPDANRYWLTVSGLESGKEYLYQYFVDGTLRIADPYTEKVSDPLDDRFIADETYPDLIEYPAGKTREIASVLQTDQAPYQWKVPTFQRPAPEDLVIYELLVRDFIAKHDYKTLIDTLNYLDNLGVNAIELMPINEFEGNESWGYGPAFYFAPDKYYGPENDLKRFIDECHKRGIAVILDMVLNHSFGQSPFVRLYSQGNYGPPTPENPWYNVTATHPLSVGYDFNHESSATKTLVDRVNAFWLTEYKVDGFRFDLSKGFTQRQSGNDLNLWAAYDASRIAILRRMADEIWEVDSTAYVILEHFADNSEEQELSEYGMMLWGNMNYNYNEATMGYHENDKSNLSWGSYRTRGWSKPRLVTYMESHDEERLMFKNLQYGNSYGSYNIKNPATALNRIKLAAAFFFTIPGPKMIWQFGEVGYDVSINNPCRVCNKPIKWGYFGDTARRNLYKTFAALIKLKTGYEAFNSENFDLDVSGAVKRINITHSTMNVTVVGNFGVYEDIVDPNFQNTGVWYDYFSGDSISVTNTQAELTLSPGEFHIYTTQKLQTPEPGIISAIQSAPVTAIRSFELHQNNPNPFNPETTIRFELPVAAEVSAKIFNLIGEEVATLVEKRMPVGTHLLRWQGVDAQGRQVGSGIYFLRVSAEKNVAVRKMMVLR